MRGHTARKRFGQNFLVDAHYVAKIVDAIDPRPGDNLVEIGPGLAALTGRLIKRAGAIHAIEIDRDLAARLAADYPPEKLALHVADALEFDYASLGPRLRIVGNLPYNISSPLLFRLAEYDTQLLDLHVMLQREVVDRMTAAPGGKEYGRLTIMLALWAKSEALFDVGPGAFTPPPKVWSTVVRLTPHTSPPFPIADHDRYAKLVAHLFSMRRKTLGRSLKGQLTPAQITATGIDPMRRPETLAPSDFALLSSLL